MIRILDVSFILNIIKRKLMFRLFSSTCSIIFITFIRNVRNERPLEVRIIILLRYENDDHASR